MTMTAVRTDNMPQVWIGCLSCYNDGRLVGEWWDASIADEITTQRTHAECGIAVDAEGYVPGEEIYGPHEELWVMDHEGLPIDGECSPMEAAKWGALFGELMPWEYYAFRAYVRTGLGSVDGDGLSDVGEFHEAYCGEFSSFQDYAEDLFDNCGYADEIPEHLRSYIDMDRWASDLELEYSAENAENGSVFVFRSL